MKQISRWIGIGLIVALLMASTLWLVVVTNRQKNFEEFTMRYVDMLSKELSLTNVRVSILESEAENAHKKLPDLEGVNQRRCGEKNKEGK